MVDEPRDGDGFARPVIHNMNDEAVQEQHAVAGTDPLEIMAMRLFSQNHGHRYRYNQDRGKWYEWTGMRWRIDEYQRAVNEMIEQVDGMRRVRPNDRKALGKISFSTNALKGAQSLPNLSVIQKDFDLDPLLLGTPVGYVDLRTGKHHPPDPTKMLSKATAVAPVTKGKPKQWLEFLTFATAGDQELIDYLQRFFGYCLSGLMKEEIMTFLYGPGGNGKGVMISALAHILGDYYVNTPSSTFMDTKKVEHATELARLNGARLVSASETNENDKWNLSRIKEITGNENPISARFMRQDFFEFWPVCKLLIVGNNKPVIGEVDPAIARRLRMIEFTQRPAEVDRNLKDKMAAEYGLILQWMIEGFLKYQEEGLVPPEAVVKASTAYLSAQDVVASFVDEWCEPHAHGILLRKDIGAAIELYTKQNGISQKIPATRVYKRLIEHLGYKDGETYKKDRCFKGLRLNDHAWASIAKARRFELEEDGFRGVRREHVVMSKVVGDDE